MKHINEYKIWFLVGSQDLYGEETLKKVEEHSKIIVEYFNSKLPCEVIFKPILVTAKSITKVINEANLDEFCGGLICWMHTFSPAKMWINGLKALNKPLLQINTQFNTEIPYSTMDMDFMNLNQSAHGDREFGYITARLNISRSIIVGHWKSDIFIEKLNKWVRAAIASVIGRSLQVIRFGDNMRDVAVTCGDKIEAYSKLGWNIPYYGIGDLVEKMDTITEKEIDNLMGVYENLYKIEDRSKNNISSIRYQARIELALEKFLIEHEAEAFCTNFQDLHGLKQLPGLACQHLMYKGYGFAGEGDWKIASMVRTLKLMGEGLEGGCSFMEDYTYNLEPNKNYNLGSHMLEVCPSISKEIPRIEVHPLGIGDKEAPARLVFNSKPSRGITCSIIDLGDHLRVVTNDINIIESEKNFEKLPVARALWIPEPDFFVSTECWIFSGAGHHNALSTNLDSDYINYWTEINKLEYLKINKKTELEDFKKQDMINRICYKYE